MLAIVERLLADDIGRACFTAGGEIPYPRCFNLASLSGSARKTARRLPETERIPGRFQVPVKAFKEELISSRSISVKNLTDVTRGHIL
jgi:hypothetical protein